MVLWKWCFCLSLLAVVLSDDMVGDDTAKLTSLKFIPVNGKYDEQLKELAHKLTKASGKEQVAILNAYADEVLLLLNQYIIDNRLEPVELSGFDASFKWTIFSGWIRLEDGWVTGLSTFQRKADVVVTYDYPHIKLRVPLGFSKLRFNYHYQVKFMKLGPDGSADGKSDNNKFTVDLTINMVTLRAKLERFNLNTLGSVSLKFSGNILTDWIINIILVVVMPILKPILGLVVHGYVVDGFEYVIGIYNNAVCTLLDDCPQLGESYYQLVQ